MSKFLPVLILLLSNFANATTGSVQCDERRPLKSSNGTELVECRINGARAKERYEQMLKTAQTHGKSDVAIAQEGGGVSGYKLQDTQFYCSTSAHRTTFQCQQILIAATGKVAVLSELGTIRSAGDSNKVKCADTNGSDLCNDNIPCCDGSICTAYENGFCD